MSQRFNKTRLGAVAGGVLALVGIFSPWVTFLIVGANALDAGGLLALMTAGILGQGTPPGPLVMYTGPVAALCSAAALAGALLAGSPRAMRGAAWAAVGGAMSSAVFIVAVQPALRTGVMGGIGMLSTGFGPFLTIIGSGVLFVYGLRHAREMDAGLSPRPPHAPWPHAPPPMAGPPCPRCGSPLAMQAPACAACGQPIQWG